MSRTAGSRSSMLATAGGVVEVVLQAQHLVAAGDPHATQDSDLSRVDQTPLGLLPSRLRGS